MKICIIPFLLLSVPFAIVGRHFPRRRAFPYLPTGEFIVIYRDIYQQKRYYLPIEEKSKLELTSILFACKQAKSDETVR